MSASNTETETESGSPDQQPECEFDADDLDISDFYKRRYDLEEWECSRPVWEEASGNRCVWHAASDGPQIEGQQFSGKPPAELEETVGDGDLHGSAATGGDLSENDFPVETGFIDADLSGARLINADLSRADLFNANLSGTDLRRADLSEANLYDADLPGGDLRRADLSEANLRHANLSSEAKLSDADLSEANLYDADLSRADLSRTDFSEANLYDADLPRADLRRADFSEADLRSADLSATHLAETEFQNSTLSRDTDIDSPSNRIRQPDSGEGQSDDEDKSWVGSQRAKIHRLIELVRNNHTNGERTYDQIARANHELREAYSANGLISRAREARFRERKARRREAVAEEGIRGTVAYLGSVLSMIVTGYGVRLRWVGGSMLLLYLASAGIYWQVGDLSMGRSLYYSIVTFTTSPPAEPDLPGPILGGVEGFETFAGTAAIVFLGYVLGTRERV